MTIFYVHRGNPYYLKYSLAQTAERFPNARIVLLGDSSNHILGAFCEHYPMDEYGKFAHEIEDVYVHLSPNPREFELFCLKRWFLVAEFVRKTGTLGPLLYLDSDVLVYDDLFAGLSEESVELATTRVLGPAFTYFGGPAVLENFVGFVLETYRTKERFALLERIFETGETPFFLKGKYVSDMQLLGLFALNLSKTRDLFTFRDDVVFDYAFHTAEGFAFNPYKRVKRIWWRQGQPYGRRNGVYIRFAGLHFQVGSKIFLPRYYRGTVKFSDRWKFRLIHLRGAVTTILKFVLDLGRKWRAEA